MKLLATLAAVVAFAPVSNARAGDLFRMRTDTVAVERLTFVAHVARDGTVAFENRSVDLSARCLFVGCAFAIDDMVMRELGVDPYATNKLRWLDDTREERFAVADQNRRDDLARSAELVDANLREAWQRETDVAARKQLVFELWDDCAEPGDGDDALVAGGEQARARLVSFVRERFPAGTAAAFTGDELARLNEHRSSRAPFSPYE